MNLKPRSTSKRPSADPSVDRNWRFRRSGALAILECKALVELKWLVHGFSTREGGESSMPALAGRKNANRILNLGYTDWDSRKNVLKNRQRWMTAVGAHKFMLMPLRQFHSDVVQTSSSQEHGSAGTMPGGNAPAGDAIISRRTGKLFSIQTADCTPILLVDPGQRAVAAIHAGWRGTMKRIALKAVGRMRMELDTKPEDILAAIGPTIGPCCYEVGYEVAREFDSQFSDAAKWFDEKFNQLRAGEEENPLPWLTMAPPGHPPPSVRTRLNLAAANLAILISAGLRARNIYSCGLCTSCHREAFFSYRKEGETGRLMASIGMRRRC